MVPNWHTFITNFIVTPPQVTNVIPSWKDDEELKQAFGIALAQNFKNSFEAACSIFGKETNKALWASTKWLEDPVVIKAKEEYSAITAVKEELLDKAALSRKLLEFSEERIIFNGENRYAAEAKDRLAALRLYADIQGFIAKDSISTTINNQPRFMEIKFVEPDKKEVVKTIEHESKVDDILENSPVKLKLVG
jgi:hypothetical protein